MGTDDLLADAVAAKDRERRYRRIETLIVSSVIIVVGLALLIGLPALSRQSELTDLSKQNVCIAKLSGDALAAFADALAAPPAPNVDRKAAVRDIKTSARRLHQVERICPSP